MVLWPRTPRKYVGTFAEKLILTVTVVPLRVTVGAGVKLKPVVTNVLRRSVEV